MIHFTRLRLAILVTLAVAAFFIYPRVADFIAMDKCLDSGGVYAYGHCGSGEEGVYIGKDPKDLLVARSAAAMVLVIITVVAFEIRDRIRHDARAT